MHPSKLSLRTIGAKAAAPKAVGAKSANTIIYIHGIGNKPIALILKCQWDTALFGTALGDRSRMAYWVNRDFYLNRCGRPAPQGGDTVTLEDEEASTKAILAMTGEKGGDEKALQKSEIAVLAQNDKQREAFRRDHRQQMAQGLETSANEYAARDVRAKILPWVRSRAG